MATVTASYNWVSGETVTPAKLNSAAAPTVVVADNEVTTSKILDANVTNAKLASGIDASKLTTGTLPIDRIADGAVTPAKLSQSLTLATAQNTTSGTSIDFTSIPSWAKRITVMLRQISTSGTSIPQIQIGSGSILTSGYLSATVGGLSGNILTGNIVGSGFALLGAATSSSLTHQGVLTLLHFGSNIWIANGSFNVTDGANFGYFINGIQSLSGALDRIRLTTVNGTDTFDAGSVNIMYEG